MQSKKTILVLYGDDDLVKIVRKRLGPKSYSFISADSTKSAKDIIAKKAPEAVLGYIGRRRKSCFATCQAVLKSFPDQPIAILTDNLEDVFPAEKECPGMGYYLGSARISPSLIQHLKAECDARRALREERDFNAAVLDSARAFIMVLAPNGTIMRTNQAFQGALGYIPTTVVGKTAKQYSTDKESFAFLNKLLKSPPRAKRSVSAGTVWKSKNGGGVYIDWSCVAIYEASGEVRHFVCTGVDVTENRLRDQELQHSHALEKLTGDIHKAFLRRDLNAAIRHSLSRVGTFLNVDSVRIYRFDVSPSLMTNTHAWTLADKGKAGLQDQKEDSFEFSAACFKNNEPAIIRNLSDLPKSAVGERGSLQRCGIKSVINAPLVLSSGVFGFLSVAAKRRPRDWDESNIQLVTSVAESVALGIVARESEANLKNTLKDMAKTIEDRTLALRASEERLRDMMEATSDWRWEMDKDLKFTYFSDSAYRVFGFDLEDIIGQTREKVLFKSAEGIDSVELTERERHISDLKFHKPFRDFQYTFRREDGSLRYLRISGKPVFDEKGIFAGYRGTGSDVTAEVEASREAARSQVQLHEAVESIDGSMMLIDQNMKFVLCNTRYREEYARLSDLLHPGTDYREILRAVIERGVIEPGDLSVEAWVQSRLSQPEGMKRTSEQMMKNGRWALVNDYVTREGGRLIVRTDITARKRMEEALRASEERRRLVLETVLEGIITIDRAGIVQSMNPAAENLFGYAAEEVLGRNISMLMPEPYKFAHDGYLRKYMAGGAPHIIGIGREVQGERKDGTVFPLELAVSEMKINDDPVFVGVIHDISRRKEDEENLLRARFEAEASNKAKSQFLANMSHELRTPLNAILGFSETMSSEVFGPIGNKRYGEYIKNIQESGHHLLTLINDILDLSKIEAGAFELYEEDTNVPELVRSCLSFVSTQAYDRNVQIHTDIDSSLPNYYLDPRRIKQVILNLLSNALKFSHVGGTVTVSAHADKGDLVLMVRDEGIGMDESALVLALAEFGQVQSAREHSRAHEGSGLGLPLSRNLVMVHNGILDVESQKGKGTNVTVRFPASRRRP